MAIGAAGDRVQVESTDHIDAVATISADGNAPETMGRYSNRNERYVETILGVDAAGRPTELRRRYLVASERTAAVDGAGQFSPTKLHGQTVTVARKGTDITVSGAPGATVAERHELEASVGCGYAALVPEGEYAIGDSWAMTPEMGPAFLRGGKAEGSVRLAEVIEHGGLECAHLVYEGTVRGVNETGWETQLRVKGDLYWATGYRRLVSATAHATGTSSYQTRRGAQVVRLAGKGATDTSTSYRWLAVAGKAVHAGREGRQVLTD